MKRLNEKEQASGSALIMTVVLTVLLSMVGMMFVMIARMDKAATSSIIENKELKAAVDSVVEIISQQLVLDTPGVDIPNQEYYDYPGDKDEWLASLEPYDDADEEFHKWQQISDITGSLRDDFGQASVEDVSVKHSVRKTILEYQTPDDVNEGELADADGDGIADSKWIELDMQTSKGKKIYAAVRVIDNSAMLNVNTAYKFELTNSSKEYEIDGRTQAQINLAGLVKDANDSNSIVNLHKARCKANKTAYDDEFRDRIIWNFSLPDSNYPQFEMSDELELRYRYCINGKAVPRLENIWLDIVGPNSDGAVSVPYDSTTSTNGTDRRLDDWQERITDYTFSEADRRHLLTTYNLDRVITPDPDPNNRKMFSVEVNRNAQNLYNRLKSCIDTDLTAAEQADKEAYFAQISANIVDYSDDDANVSVVEEGSDEYYGFERPFIYISEIVRNFYTPGVPEDVNTYRSYAVELYKNFHANEKFDRWRLTIAGEPAMYIEDSFFETRGGSYYVIVYENTNASLEDEVKFSDSPNNGATGVDPEVRLNWGRTWFAEIPDPNGEPNKTIDVYSDSYDVYFGTTNPPPFLFTQSSSSYPPTMVEDTTYYWRIDSHNDANDYHDTGSVWSFTTWPEEPNSVYAWTDPCDSNDIILEDSGQIILEREVEVDGSLKWIKADQATVPPGFDDVSVPGIYSYQRDITWSRRVKRLWQPNSFLTPQPLFTNARLGHSNIGYIGSCEKIQPFHSSFETIGEIGKVFRKSTYLEGDVKYQIKNDPFEKEEDVRIDLEDPDIQKVFRHLTVMDPDNFSGNLAAETRVKGRLNINTAPKFLIQQLPWVTPELAEAIVAYRDMTEVASDDTINYNDRNDATGLDPDDYPLRDEIGFASVGELMTVINKDHETDFNKRKYSIQTYGLDNRDQRGFPDLSTNSRMRTDGVVDDLEEEQLIFARISDLVTVRSDVFTAYVLVRLGTDGPQKRIVAILDRSGVDEPKDKVRIRALQLTPEAR